MALNKNLQMTDTGSNSNNKKKTFGVAAGGLASAALSALKNTTNSNSTKPVTGANATQLIGQQLLNLNTPVKKDPITSYSGQTIPVSGSPQIKTPSVTSTSKSTTTSKSSSNSSGSSKAGSSSGFDVSQSVASNPQNISDAINQLQASYEAQISSQFAKQQQALQDALSAQQARYEAQLKAQQEAQEKAAQNAYNTNLASLLEAYNANKSNLGNSLDSTKESLQSNLDNAIGKLQGSYDASTKTLNDSAEQVLREAYINRMLSEKNLAQQLSANGLTGGMAESTRAGLLNNYGNSRNNIEVARNNNLATLLQQFNSDKADAQSSYEQNMASAQQAYANALSNLENAQYSYKAQLANDLANNIVGSYGDLHSGLASGLNSYNNALTNLINSQQNDYADFTRQLYAQRLASLLG